jgi:hypothetical protein
MIGVANLVDITPFDVTFQGNVSYLLESLLINTTLSITNFLSRPALPDLSKRNISQLATYSQLPVFTSTYPPQYLYNRVPLCSSYGVALGLVGICCVVGGLMVRPNGMAADLGFSQVLTATRNSTFDKICKESRMANSGMSAGGQKHVHLRYGIFPGDDARMLAFGTEDEIVPIWTNR